MTDIINHIKYCQTIVNRLNEIDKKREDEDIEFSNLLGELSSCLVNIENNNTHLNEQLASLQSEIISVKAMARSRWADFRETPIGQKWGCYLFKDDDALYCTKCWTEHHFKIPTDFSRASRRKEHRVCDICLSKNKLEFESASLREQLAVLKLENIKLKVKLDKGLDIEKPNGVKWGYYLFDSDNGFYCAHCWDFNGLKSKTSQFNKNNCICPVCNPKHPVFQKIKPNFENIAAISLKIGSNNFFSNRSREQHLDTVIKIEKKGLWNNTEKRRKITIDNENNIVDINTIERRTQKQLSEVQMLKLSELLSEINIKAVKQLSYFNKFEDTSSTCLEIFFDRANGGKSEPIIMDVDDGVVFDDKIMNFVEYTDEVSSPSYLRKHPEIEGEVFEYEVMVGALKAYNELKDYIYSL